MRALVQSPERQRTGRRPNYSRLLMKFNQARASIEQNQQQRGAKKRCQSPEPSTSTSSSRVQWVTLLPDEVLRHVLAFCSSTSIACVAAFRFAPHLPPRP